MTAPWNGIRRILPTRAVRAAFNAHQQRDKGFGPSLGPSAGAYLVARLGEAGYHVTTASSPWRLGPDDHELMVANAIGVAAAARDTGQLSESDVTDWLAVRRRGAGCTIGHLDILCPPVKR